MTVDAIKNVLNGIQPGVNRKTVRDLLVLELLYQTGCRADEIINLRKDQIDFQRNQIKVLGKGKIERIIPLKKGLTQLIKKHLKLWKGKNQTPYLISNNKGKKLYPMFLWRLIRRYFKTEGISAHTIRHSFATHLYHNRAPIKAIRDLLGHQSLRSTTAYLHLDIFQLIQIYTNSHPRTQPVRQQSHGLSRSCEPPKGERRFSEVSPASRREGVSTVARSEEGGASYEESREECAVG